MRSHTNLMIRERLRLILMVVSTAAVVLACAAFITSSAILLRHALVQDMFSLARVIANNCQAALAFDIPSDAEVVLAALRDKESVVSAMIYRPDGEVFAAYPADRKPSAAQPRRRTKSSEFRDGSLHLYLPILLHGSQVGVLYLENNLETTREALRREMLATVVVLALALGAAYLLSGRLEHLVSAPILSLTETARAITEEGNYNVRAPEGGRDEVGLLTQAFNRMLSGISERDAALRKEVGERRRAEEQLRVLNATLEQRVATRTRDLKRSNQDLERFAYSASHDLQEPLRKVVAFGSLVQKECEGKLEGDGQDYMDRMMNATHRMQDLISGLLDYSRVATRGKAFVAVDMNDVVRGVLSDLETLSKETGGTVDVAELPVLDGDPTQLRQLMQNLIGNALKFHHPGKPPHVKVYAETNGQGDSLGEPSPASYRLVVEDDGIGFEKQYKERIFGVFQRLHRRDEYDGSGIGLAVCRRIADRHGGTITARSTPGQGATFIVTLPAEHIRQPDEE